MHQLLRLLADNRRAPRCFKIAAEANEATVYLYDVIVSDQLTAEWFGGVAPEPFVKALNEITTPVIHLRINSPGGDVFAARVIEQALREHSAEIIVHIDGYAASAASIVAMAGDQIEIAQGGFVMIHNAWTVAFGNAQDLLDMAALLEKIDVTLAQTYSDKTGKTVEDIKAMMAAETWLSGQEAVDAGFANRLYQSTENKTEAKWNLAAYAKAPPSPVHESEPAVIKDKYDTDRLKRQLNTRAGCRQRIA